MMKKLLVVLLLSFVVLLTGCVDDTTNLEVVYKLDKQFSYSSEEVYQELDQTSRGIYVYIVLKNEFSLDGYKAMITPEMTAAEVDAIIELSREVAKKQFTSFNELFITKYNLRSLTGLVDYASYGPFVTIHYQSFSLNEADIEQLIYLSHLEEVEYIEFQVQN